MARDAGVCAHVKAAKITHPGGNTDVVGPISPRVTAQPAARGAVTAFARDAFIGTHGGREPTRRDRLQRRMANGAARARLRLSNPEPVRDPGRARIEQHRKSLRVIIVLAPRDVLASLGARAAMAARRFASDGADKGAFTELLRFLCQKGARARGEEKRDARSFQQHAKSLPPAFCKMPLQRWVPFLLVGRGSAEPQGRR